MKYYLLVIFILKGCSSLPIETNNISSLINMEEVAKLPYCSRISFYETYSNNLEVQKQYKESLTFRTMSSISEIKCYGLNGEMTPYSLSSLARITELVGDNEEDKLSRVKYYKGAIKSTKGAIYYKEMFHGNDSMDLFSFYYTLSRLYNKVDDYRKSYEAINKSIDFYKRDKDLLFTVLNKSEKYNFNKQVLESMNLYLSSSYHLNKDDIKQNIFENWINFKGSINAHENALQSLKYFIINHNSLSDKEKNDFLKKLKDLKKYKKEYSISKSIENKNKIDGIESDFSEKVIKYKNYLGLKNLNSFDIQSILEKQNALYLDFARTDENYYLFTMDKLGKVTFDQISIEKTKNIDIKIDNFRNKMKVIANNDGLINKNIRDSEINNLKLLLSKLYMDILPKFLQKKLRKLEKDSLIIISPDAKLNFLPFDTLVINSGECLRMKPSKSKICISDNEYLIEKFKIKYIPSAKELVRLDKFNINDEQNSKSIAFLNPSFHAKKIKTNRSGTFGTFTNKSCQESILELTDLDTKLTASLSNRMNPKVYSKEDASEKNLLSQSNVDVMDITTHGLYCEDKEITNPMLKTMLVLSGAKESIKNDKSTSINGIVTALEISSMNLEGTKLVTLSACQTGLGEIKKAEGIASINQAFIQAGAKNVISTLWSVAQNETGELMEKFYNEKNVQNNPSSALRNAKIDMITRHPYYWSGFVLYGK